MNLYPSSAKPSALIRECAERAPWSRCLAAIGTSLPADSSLYVVGGFVRDALVAGYLDRPFQPHDLDIVVTSAAAQGVVERLVRSWTRTPTGGYRFALEQCAIDLWSIRDTYYFDELGVQPSLENLLLGAPFNLDSALYDPRESTLWDGGCVSGVLEGVIVYCPTWAIEDMAHVFCAKAALLQMKTDFRFDKSVQTLMDGRPWAGREEELLAHVIDSGYAMATAEAVLEHLRHLAPESED